MKAIAVLLVVFVAVGACQHTPTPSPRIVLDGSISWAYAAQACYRNGEVDQECAAKMSAIMARFEDQLHANVAGDPVCQGVSFVRVGGPQNRGRKGTESTRTDPYWALQLKFTPGAEKQSWSMHSSDWKLQVEGNDDTRAIAHRVCAVASERSAALPSRPNRRPPLPPEKKPQESFAPCKADDLCCPSVMRRQEPSRLGSGPPPPTLIKRVESDLAAVARPYPCGVVIMDLAISERGEVVSSCVLRSVRDDFDKAAQVATHQWRWRLPPDSLQGKPPGMMLTVTVVAPGTACGQ